MSEIGKAYVQIEPTAKGISKKIEGEFASVGESSGASFSSGFGKVLGGMGKMVVGAVGAGATAVAGIVSSAVKGFGDYEQLVGGVETLFGDSAQTVVDNANKAFQTAGMSANEYMENVTSFSASLLQSLGGDTQESAKMADQAMIDMSDNANKMGTSMESITNAYQGFAKQNFTMLDNLKLGYGGTKTEMERLMRDAEEMAGMELGSLDTSNFADVVQAIHIVQDSIGITGTTAEEASTTIQGSLASMQSAWSNLVTGMATEGADVSGLITKLVDSIKTFGSNLMPVIKTALEGVSQLIAELAPVIAQELPKIIQDSLPALLSAGIEVVKTLAEGILQAIPQLLPSITSFLLELGNLIISLAPMLLQTGLQIAVELINGLAQAMPTLIPLIVEVIGQLAQILVDNAPLLIEAGYALLSGILMGLIEGIPTLVSQLPSLINQFITTALPMLIQGSVNLITQLLAHWPEILVALIQAIPQIIMSIVEAIVSCAPMFLSAFQQIGTAIFNYLQSLGSLFIPQVQQLGTNILTTVKTWLAQLPIQVAYFVGQMLGKFVQLLQTLPSKIEIVWNQIITNLKAFAQRFITEGVNTVRDFAQRFIEGLQALPGQVMEIGGQIVDGLKNGIAGAWDSLSSYVSNMASSLVQGFKDSFKIGSPSKIMRDEVGQWIPAGIAEGIMQGMGALNSAVGSMQTTLSPNVLQSVTPYAPAPQNGTIYELLATYLPVIASGENVNVSLDVSNERLFRIVQTEQRRNKQLVGVNA